MNFPIPSGLKTAVKRSPLWPLVVPRRFHAYCVGAPKTGTSSLYSLFEKNYRASHEASYQKVVGLVAARRRGEPLPPSAETTLWRRDRRLWLEMESSNFMAWFCDVLVRQFPEAKFIFTIRPPRSWLRSALDQHLNVDVPPGSEAERFRDAYHGPKTGYVAGEEALREHGLYTLDGYLGYWAAHNRMVLRNVPEDRLLTVRTRVLSEEIERIARFLGISAETLNHRSRHTNKSKGRHGIIEEIDQDLLQQKIDEHCGDVAAHLNVPT